MFNFGFTVLLKSLFNPKEIKNKDPPLCDEGDVLTFIYAESSNESKFFCII